MPDVYDEEQTLKRRFFLDWINKYCNQDFDETDLPGGVELALIKLLKTDAEIPLGISSQSVGDMSITYTSGAMTEAGSPMMIEVRNYLAPYIRMRTL